MGQSIRPSQFITTYGPGGIIEGERGPRVIVSLQNSSLFNSSSDLENYEILDQRLSESLLDGGRIVRIPSNAELGRPDDEETYQTSQFPQWSLCVDHDIIYRFDIHKGMGCPKCPKSTNKWDDWLKSRKQAMRFILACEDGHMDDVNWLKLVRHKASCNGPYYMLWEGGGSLSEVKIKCPICGEEANLGYEYGSEHFCSGKRLEDKVSESCNKKAKMIQRGAANLRIPEIITSLRIPPRATEIHELLSRRDLQLAMCYREFRTKNEIIELLNMLVNDGKISPEIVTRIKIYPEDIIFQALNDVAIKATTKNLYEFRVDELNELQKAATHGAPLQMSDTPGAPPRFEVVKKDIQHIKYSPLYTFRVTPLSRLTVVSVQLGYRRLEPNSQNIVSVEYTNNGQKWYPGVELHGEGVFIDLEPLLGDVFNDQHKLIGVEKDRWLEAYLEAKSSDCYSRLKETYYLHPMFVWWHTLSHRLINALSVDSGYSSASIRERVYINFTDNGVTGGILLYTAQPGGDGTLGGLIATVPNFKRLLDVAFRDIFTCSNDPLCSEHEFTLGEFNGAACYACQLISETSCEHRNMFLDRNLLKSNFDKF